MYNDKSDYADDYGNVAGYGLIMVKMIIPFIMAVLVLVTIVVLVVMDVFVVIVVLAFLFYE